MASVAGEIDPVENLVDSKYWIYSGESDTVVKSEVVKTIPPFYEAFNVSSGSIKPVFDFNSEHCFPT